MNTTHCVFVGSNLDVLCYLYDLILFGADEDFIENSYHKLAKNFQVKNLHKPMRFLRSDMNQTNDCSMKFSEEQLIQKAFEETAMECYKPIVSLIYESVLANSAASDPLDEDEHETYHSVIGSLKCIVTGTRPDLSIFNKHADFLPAWGKVLFYNCCKTIADVLEWY